MFQKIERLCYIPELSDTEIIENFQNYIFSLTSLTSIRTSLTKVIWRTTIVELVEASPEVEAKEVQEEEEAGLPILGQNGNLSSCVPPLCTLF